MFGLQWPVILVLPAFIICIIFGLFGSRLAAYRGRDAVMWFLLCAVFPPFIFLLIYFKPKKNDKQQIRQCPYCKQFIEWKATVCKHCKRSFKEPLVETTPTDEYDRPFKM
jgi:hypothetical protein